MRDALIGCATNEGLTGELHAVVELDQSGIAISVASGYGDPFASCVGTAIMHTRFAAQRGRRFAITFFAPDPRQGL